MMHHLTCQIISWEGVPAAISPPFMTCCYFWSQQTFGHLLCLCICTSLRTEKARNLIWNEYLKSKSWMVQRFNKIFTIHFYTIWMQTVFKASWSAASSTVSKPKAWEETRVCQNALNTCQTTSSWVRTLHHSTLKIQSGRYLSASSIFLLFPGNVLQTFFGSKECISCYLKRDPQPNAASEEMIEGACKTRWV